MDIFDVLNLIGGLSLFLFGMNVMGLALERRAGNSLKDLLAKMTTSKVKGFLTGLIITMIIQSSSATTVMVVGFVNSSLMTLKQAINVIMGANIGTTITAWILSLGGISSDNIFIKLLNPSSFTPILALIGVIFYMFLKDKNKKDLGLIFLGFAVLMFGMDTMSDSVSGLADVPTFRNLFILFTNPLLGVLVGLIVTGIIQSSSASVGILQALALTGQVSYGAAIPIIMGQNIGTCVTALLSSIGTNKNARRAGIVHLMFNVIGTVFCLTIFCIMKYTINPTILSQSASMVGIAICHSCFNIICVIILFPLSSVLEKIAYMIVKEDSVDNQSSNLDTRLFVTPSLALEQAKNEIVKMSYTSKQAIFKSLQCIYMYDEKTVKQIEKLESKVDKYDDDICTYLVKLSSQNILNEQESEDVSFYLKVIGDFERISDHSINVIDAIEELRSKNLQFSSDAINEIKVMTNALNEIIDISFQAFKNNDINIASKVGPLEDTIDQIKVKLKDNHIKRIKSGQCSIETGFIWLQLLTDLERVSDHCNNIAIEIINALDYHNMRLHKTKISMMNNNDYQDLLQQYNKEYLQQI